MTPSPGTFHDEAEETADAAARGHVEAEHVHGITREQWAYWHSHPVTRLMREYLRDFSEALEVALMARWRQRALVLADEHEIRNRILQISEIDGLRFDDVQRFYDQPQEVADRVVNEALQRQEPKE